MLDFEDAVIAAFFEREHVAGITAGISDIPE